MKISKLSFALLAVVAFGSAQAAVITAGSTSTTAGSTTSPVPISITADGSTGLIQANVSYDNTRITLAQGNVSGVATGFTCTVDQPSGTVVIIGGNDAGPIAANTTICSIAFPVNVGATFPIPLDVNGQLCSTFNGNPTGQPCDAVDGAITQFVGTFNYAATPATLTYNGVVGAATPTQNVNIAAQGGNTGPVTFSACSFAGANAADFAMSPAPTFPLNVAAGANVNIPIAFTAGALGARTATFSCATANGTAVGGSFPITLNGTGVTNTLTTTPTITFPATLVGSPATGQNVTAQAGAGNTGNVTITNCAISGANAGDFSQTPAVNNLAVAPGASVNVPVGFTPTAPGARTATLTCNLTNGPAATFVTTLNGTGTAAAAIINPTTANGTTISGLGSAGTPLQRSVTFVNSGNAAGTVTCTVAGAGFTVSGPLVLGAPVPPATTSGNITVTGTSGVPTTLIGTLNCTDTVGGVYAYPLSFTFGAPSVAQIPAVGSFGLFAMLGLFAGLGMFFVFRNRA